jgi:hypothetical protein
MAPKKTTAAAKPAAKPAATKAPAAAANQGNFGLFPFRLKDLSDFDDNQKFIKNSQKARSKRQALEQKS